MIVGQKVNHTVFGDGVIEAIVRRSNNVPIAYIKFKDQTIKLRTDSDKVKCLP